VLLSRETLQVNVASLVRRRGGRCGCAHALRWGVTNRSLHSTRHTFITLARRGGARTEVVEQITHNAAGTIVDHYTHRDWNELCQAVLALQLPAVDVAKNVATLSVSTAFLDETRWRRRESNPSKWQFVTR
jgi:integrase